MRVDLGHLDVGMTIAGPADERADEGAEQAPLRIGQGGGGHALVANDGIVHERTGAHLPIERLLQFRGEVVGMD